MIDALYPAADALKKSIVDGKSVAASWREATIAAEAGAQATKAMRPRLGRASYLVERAVGSPDGGAVTVSCWMGALTAVIPKD